MKNIYAVKNGKSVHLDVKANLWCGLRCLVIACPYDVIRLSGKGEMTLSEQKLEDHLDYWRFVILKKGNTMTKNITINLISARTIQQGVAIEGGKDKPSDRNCSRYHRT